MKVADTPPHRQSHTLDEIFSQPDCWRECLRQLTDSQDLASASKLGDTRAEWILIGCGSSYYLAMAAASTFNHLGLAARAVPASEILLFPELYLPNRRHYVPILISRSGTTSEVLNAATFLQLEHKLKTLAITCAHNPPLESLAAITLKLTSADEKSVVMTRSFTSMLLGLQYLAATISNHRSFRESLVQL